MINLSTNRNMPDLAKAFYARISQKLNDRLDANLTFFNSYSTKSGQPLGDFLNSNLEGIITNPLTDQSAIEKEIKTVVVKHYKNIGKTKTFSDFKKAINNVFFYEDHDVWEAYQTTIDLKINACPYCNRSYIRTVGTDKAKFIRADFDHFLAKSKYPYFRLSFYNLIPSCIICNRNAKGKTSTALDGNIFPYSNGFENHTKFTYIPGSYDELIGNGEPEIDFIFLGDLDHQKKSKKNIELFRLKEQYSIHYQELNDLIRKRRIFSDSYLRDLVSTYQGLLGSFQEAYLIAFGKEFDLSNDEKRPLSKFTRDIAEELGMLIELDN